MMNSQQVDHHSELEDQSYFSDTSNWNKLSPISILFFLAKVFSQVISNALPSLAPLGVLFFTSDSKVMLALVVFIGALVLLMVNAVLQYFFFRYKIENNKILIHEGVLKKNQRVIRFDKIQNINILQPFYFKHVQLVTLQLETAGSKNNEANLAGINISDAEQIKQNILSIRSKTILSDRQFDNSLDDLDAIQTLSTASTTDLVKFGLTSNGMFWFFVFMAPLFGMLDKIIENNIAKENVKWFVEQLGGGLSGGLFFVTAVVFSIFTLMLSFSILGAIFRYHNYQLTFMDNTLKRHSGLLGTHEESAKLAKIQAFVNQTNFIGRWLKVENVSLKQASGSQNKPNARNKLFIIPTLTADKTASLLKFILNIDDFHPKLNPINKRYISKTWLVLMFVPLLLAIFLSFTSETLRPLLILLVGVPLCPLIYLRWKNFGYAINKEFATFRSGFIGFKRITFVLFKVQRVIINQSPLQKRRGLATLTIYLASDRIVIPYIPIEHAQQWFDKISYQIETTKQSWF